jgi:hypothetical protein
MDKLDEDNIVRRRTVRLRRPGGAGEVLYAIEVVATFALRRQDPFPDELTTPDFHATYQDAQDAAEADFGSPIDRRRWQEDPIAAGAGRASSAWTHCGDEAEAALFYDAQTRTHWVAQFRPADEVEVRRMKREGSQGQ